jgi:hypothetical protein
MKVEYLLSLSQRLAKMGKKTTYEKARLEKEKTRIITEIDQLVYDVYGITEEERQIIKKVCTNS